MDRGKSTANIDKAEVCRLSVQRAPLPPAHVSLPSFGEASRWLHLLCQLQYLVVLKLLTNIGP